MGSGFSFKGDYEQAVMYSIVNEETASPKNLRKDIAADLDKIIMHALAKDKKSRYGSINKFCQDLINYKSTLSVSESSDPKFHTRKKPTQKLIIYGFLFFIVLSILLFVLVDKKMKSKWAKEEALPEIVQLAVCHPIPAHEAASSAKDNAEPNTAGHNHQSNPE